MRIRAVLAFAALCALAACGDAAPPSTSCGCTPRNSARSRGPDGRVRDGAALLAQLRRRQREVSLGKHGRDVKLIDDELRLAVAEYCQPCGAWVGDRRTIAELFPLGRLDDAADLVCLGLVLRDGSTVYGDARPPACR